MAWTSSFEAAVADVEHFSSRTNEFRLETDARREANAFVASALPPGLPISEARRRVEAAEMTCRTSRRQPGLTCEYVIAVPAPGVALGDNVWTLRLQGDPAGRLAVASLTYDRANFDTP